MSIARHHTEWLSLIEISGPFVSLPVLSKVFPQGLDERDPEKARNLRNTFEAYQEAPNNLAAQLAWVKFVLSDTLSFYPEHLKEGQEIPPGLKAELLEHRETLRPDIAVVVPRTSESGEKVQQTQLLVSVYLKDQDLDAPIKGTHWKASPATRMAELLHASDVPLGLVTNGERWMLVYAPRGETTGFTSWYASLWFEEPKTLRAFHSLLSLQRVVGSADTLLSMLRESASDQQEVTDKLGRQVRDAVDVLVSAFSRLNIDAQGKLLEGISEKELYNAALTVMMRLVFLFCAEERGMLHLGKPLYDNNYAVSTLREQLQEDADQHGEEVLERRSDAWVRLLATFRAVYGGVTHEDLSLPAYGGSLFNPDRYAFLEGRPVGTEWITSEAAPPKIDNRVVLHLLRSLQMLQDRDSREARRLSFRALDIEQIGHVYEGLLDHTAVRAEKTMLGLEGSKKLEPMRSLEELEAELATGETSFLKYLKETTGRSESALKKALNSILLVDTHKLMIACHNNQGLYDRVLPFAGLLRQNSFEMPLVILEGSVFVTSGTDRRSSGTHYTPRTLTEPVVKNTLEPLVYVGPAEGLPREEWKLKTPREILELKVCDMAMGSGAFLTEACRYLAERLVEAWEQGERDHPEAIMVTPEGDFSHGFYTERVIPGDSRERLTVARRIIADRCLYGVDINPMAVEMAKLSLWLVTMQRDRPFNFLNHNVKNGDSLIGITDIKQLIEFSLKKIDSSLTLSNSLLPNLINPLIKKRKIISRTLSENYEQISSKIHMFVESELISEKLRTMADSLINLEFRSRSSKEYSSLREIMISRALDILSSNENTYRSERSHAFHWCLEFPEVFASGGFNAIIGNPPFIGGKKISGIFGDDYRQFLKNIVGNAITGSADYSAYFLIMASRIISANGFIGLISTTTIAQGDTREVGLDEIVKNGFKIYNAVSSQKWPGMANQDISIIYYTKRDWNGAILLNSKLVNYIAPDLTNLEISGSKPFRLIDRKKGMFQGTLVNGEGFVIDEREFHSLLSSDSRNCEVVKGFLSGDDINTVPAQNFTRWVIDFQDWSMEKARSYPTPFHILEERVKPYRDEIVARGKQIHEYSFWRFWDKRLESYSRARKLQSVIVTPLVSKYINFTFQPSDIIFNHKVGIVVSDSYSIFALLQSTMHCEWAYKFSSSRGTGVNYSISDAFETFPYPSDIDNLYDLGVRYFEFRSQLMIKRNQGITKLLNDYHNPAICDSDIWEFRILQQELDKKVLSSYGWNDLSIRYDFFPVANSTRFCIDDLSKTQILRRLLELNNQQYKSAQVPDINKAFNSKNLHAKSSKENQIQEENTQRNNQERLF